MISKSDAQNTIEFKDFYIIYADSDYFKVKKEYLYKRKRLNFKFCKEVFEYNSNKNKFLSVSEIRKIIKKNKFLISMKKTNYEKNQLWAANYK